MTTERNELAKLLGDHFGTSAGGDDYLWAMADIILERGYTKPRMVTTLEELNDLHMAVVRTSAGSIANIVNERAYFFGYEASCPASTLALPATVLHDPSKDGAA